jgi:beta-lactamase regulating signal transducer with metallopeptidase domain
MTPLAYAISRALIHFLWQGSVIGILLWVTLAALKRRSPSARYIVACAALVMMAAAPSITAWRIYWGGTSGRTITGALQASASGSGPIRGGFETYASWPGVLQDWALPIWSFGVLLFSARLIFGYRHAFLLRRRGNPAGAAVIEIVMRLARVMDVRRPIRVLMSTMTDTPSVVGWLRPVILLPAATLMGLTSLQLEAILAHEIGHIKRYDYLVNMLQMLAETLLFYHPAVWWTSKRIRVEREMCCDDLAVRFSGNALRYARALTRLEKLRLTTPGVAMASTGGPLLYRIQRVAGVGAKEYGTSRLPVVLAIALGVLCVALNVSWVRAQDAAGVKVDLGGAGVIHRTSVPYPEIARKSGMAGTVQLEVTLDDAGAVSDARVLSGPEELRKVSLESVLNWHFTRDSARSTRLVSISFSDAGKQVQVSEPQTARTVVATSPNGEYQAVLTADGRQFVVNLLEKSQEDEEKRANLTRRQQLERDMAKAKEQIEDASRQGDAASRAALVAKLQALQREFESTPLPRRWERPNFVGLTLKAINTGSLPENARNDLLSRLPVRVGDTLSSEAIRQTEGTVHAYDEHLRFEYVSTADGQAELRIIVPGAERR